MPKLRKWLKRRPYQPTFAIAKVAPRAQPTRATAQFDEEPAQHLAPYDEHLLERSRTQWQLGDWANLAALSQATLQHPPDRAELALLGAAAEARQYTRHAIDWRCSKRLVRQILKAGVHNTLGRVVAVSGQEQCALQHFQASLQVGAPQSDVRLLAQARVSQQFSQLGLSAPAPQMSDTHGALNPSGARLNLSDITH